MGLKRNSVSFAVTITCALTGRTGSVACMLLTPSITNNENKTEILKLFIITKFLNYHADAISVRMAAKVSKLL
jgi:hypothetical protein